MRYLGNQKKCPSHHPSMRLQQEVRNFFSTFPYVLIVKNNTKIRCYCYDAQTDSSDTKCPSCLGSGWIPTIEKHRCWHNTAIAGDTLTHLISVLDPGAVVVDERAFYFLPEASPQTGDYIVVADFDKNGLPRYRTQQFYKVNHSDLRFDDHGVPTFYKASAKKDPVDAKIKSFNLYRMRNKIMIVPVLS